FCNFPDSTTERDVAPVAPLASADSAKRSNILTVSSEVTLRIVPLDLSGRSATWVESTQHTSLTSVSSNQRNESIACEPIAPNVPPPIVSSDNQSQFPRTPR